MAEGVTVSAETVTDSLTVLVDSSKVLLQKAKLEAEGRAALGEGCACGDGLHWKFECFNVLLLLQREVDTAEGITSMWREFFWSYE